MEHTRTRTRAHTHTHVQCLRARFQRDKNPEPRAHRPYVTDAQPFSYIPRKRSPQQGGKAFTMLKLLIKFPPILIVDKERRKFFALTYLKNDLDLDKNKNEDSLCCVPDECVCVCVCV